MSVPRKIYFAATGFAIEKSHKCLYFIISDSSLVFRTPTSILSLSGFFHQKHEVEIHGVLELALLFSVYLLDKRG